MFTYLLILALKINYVALISIYISNICGCENIATIKKHRTQQLCDCLYNRSKYLYICIITAFFQGNAQKSLGKAFQTHIFVNTPKTGVWELS